MLYHPVNSDLAYTSSYLCHWPPVLWLHPGLDAFKLVACRLSRVWREGTDLLPGTTNPE